MGLWWRASSSGVLRLVRARAPKETWRHFGKVSLASSISRRASLVTPSANEDGATESWPQERRKAARQMNQLLGGTTGSNARAGPNCTGPLTGQVARWDRRARPARGQSCGTNRRESVDVPGIWEGFNLGHELEWAGTNWIENTKRPIGLTSRCRLTNSRRPEMKVLEAV